MSRPYRKTVKSPGDMARRAKSCLKAARTLLLEARDSYRWASREYQSLNDGQLRLNDEIRWTAHLAWKCDTADAKRRARRATQKRRAA